MTKNEILNSNWSVRRSAPGTLTHRVTKKQPTIS